MASNVPWEWTQLKTEYGFLESFYESTSSCQGQGVTVARPRPADSRVQFAVSQKKKTQKNKLNISSRGLMGGTGRESNLNPVKALVKDK